jgi:hypothetical protein
MSVPTTQACQRTPIVQHTWAAAKQWFHHLEITRQRTHARTPQVSSPVRCDPRSLAFSSLTSHVTCKEWQAMRCSSSTRACHQSYKYSQLADCPLGLHMSGVCLSVVSTCGNTTACTPRAMATAQPSPHALWPCKELRQALPTVLPLLPCLLLNQLSCSSTSLHVHFLYCSGCLCTALGHVVQALGMQYTCRHMQAGHTSIALLGMCDRLQHCHGVRDGVGA